MARGYIIVASHTSFEENENGQSGQVVLVESLTDKEPFQLNTLPERGDAFNFLGTVAGSCKLRRIVRSYVEGDQKRIKYHLSYDTNAPGRGGGSGAMSDPMDRRWNYSGEMTSIQRPTGWKWELANTDITSESGVSLGKRVICIDFDVPTGELTYDQFITYSTRIEANAGKINSDTFEGFSKGNVLLNGASGGTFRNSKGLLRYRFSTNFSTRFIPERGTNGWQYVMRPDGVWDKPMHGTDYLYQEANMNIFLY